MAHDRLNYGGILLLIHEERRERISPKVVEPEPSHNFAVTVVGDTILDSDNARGKY
jgi:hypothetical protein